MKNTPTAESSLQYFYNRLKARSHAVERYAQSHQMKEPVNFCDIDSFFRALMTQNIFLFTVGVNGKRESTILSKAIFSMNRVVRIYYSTSFDDTESGFIRIRPDDDEDIILVERLHGYRAQPEVLYASPYSSHVIRFMIRWLIRRIDWSKTKIDNLDLQKYLPKKNSKNKMGKLNGDDAFEMQNNPGEMEASHAE
ncbi:MULTISPECIES: hypothetical protein [Thiomicrorhabdus]|uniref:DUF1249 domain-containing protein n=1 Tax=Thiomicrorhabdus heinhorstiae TaxID=2748010 RepID=A0ABS0C0Z7_9GAMM|nr:MULTISPECIES: hypothetical protein [Thiomicrorhabdus]MBF6058955.1 hypothetical protein [Thiomicrorhabdus heinhorstiae]